MAEGDGARPALGLRRLAGVVDDEGIDQRPVADQGFRPARPGERYCLARQPFERAVGADVYQGIRLSLEPEVEGDISVAGRAEEVVVILFPQLRRAAFGLQRDERCAAPDGGEGETAFHELRTIAMGEVADEQSFLYALNAAVDAFADHHAEQILTLRKSQSTAMIVFVCALVIGTLVIVRPMLRRVTAMADNLDELAVTDPMTSALNRRGFMLRGAELIESAPRCAVLVIDIDHFKRVNDVFGHAAGDTCIRHVASLAKEVFRASDVFGRIGGEEFGAVLADVSLDTALLVAERLSEVVRSTPCDVASVLRRAETVDVTISVGVAVCDIGSRLELIMQQADSALYQAKRAGRDRVLSFEQSQSLVLGEFSPTSTRVRSSGQA